jgi:chemotaxis protein methyltransferase CheR
VRLSDEAYLQARILVASRLGLEFPEARRPELERGFLRAWRTAATSSPETYLAALERLPEGSPELRRLAGHLTVGETYFFRDRACFEALEQDVLPALIAARRSEGTLRLRIWSAGCATGEEPYSLAIVLDRLLHDRSDWALTILATDISPTALEAAGEGRYREWSFRETPSWVRDRYFQRQAAGGFELDAGIRRMITFAPLNLAEDGYPAIVTNTSAMDLILCRSVLMYFTREAQREAVARLQRSLVPGGWLLLSPAEASAELLRPLTPVNFPNAIFYRKETAPAVPLPPSWHAEPTLPEPPIPLVPEGIACSPVAPPPGEQVEVPPDRAAQLQRARALADQGHLEEAHRLCEAALGQDPLHPEAYILLAAIRQEQGEIPPALEALRRAIYLAPDSAPAHFLLGSLLLRQEKKRRARRCMETVVRLLQTVPPDEPVPGSDGLAAGRLLETARGYLEAQR